jgi:hypothetical protein
MLASVRFLCCGRKVIFSIRPLRLFWATGHSTSGVGGYNSPPYENDQSVVGERAQER